MIKGDKVEILLEATATIDKENNKKHDIFIRVPANQDEITIEDICHLFVSGISLMIKQSKNDAELMDEVIEHLNAEFASSDEKYKNTYFLNKETFPGLNDNNENNKQQ